MSKTRTLAGLVSNGNPLADGTISPSEIGAATSSDILRISGVTYPGNDLAANPAGGQTITINGSGFASTPTIYVGGVIAPSVTFVSATQLTFTTPAKTAGTYDIYVVNPNGATAIFVYGLSYSGTPTWTTTAGSLGSVDSDFTIQLVATGDAPITYALSSGSTLPSGVTLSSSGLITGTNQNTEQTFNFSVDAIDAQVQETPRSFSVTILLSDPYFEYISLLLRGDGANGAHNNTFIDSSSNNFTITRTGNTTQGTFSPYGSNWSNYFDGSGDYLQVSSTPFDFSGGADFTLEFFMYIPAGVSYGFIYQNYSTSPGITGQAINAGTDFVGFESWAGGDQSPTFALSGTTIAGQWNHVALVRNGSGTNNISLYINGSRVQQGTFTSFTAPAQASTNIGARNYLGYKNYLTGYISNLRIVKGTGAALYSGATITVPTTALTVVPNTVLLICGANRLWDTSSNNYSITRTGDVSVQRFSPFSPTSAYSTSVIGGSAYLDGNGDYLQTTPLSSAFTFGTGDFNLSAWIYPTTVSGIQSIIDLRTSSNPSAPVLYLNGATLTAAKNDQTNVLSGGTIVANAWNFTELTRTSGSWRLFINGTLVAGPVTDTINYTTNQVASIGIVGINGTYPFSGFMTDVHILKGTGGITSTLPTTPLTSTTNTSFLLNATNAGILDNAMVNNPQTVGNAQVSTSVKKYGTGSIYFDGNGDYLQFPLGQSFNLGTSSFTIEMWINPSTTNHQSACLFTQEHIGASNTPISLCIWLSGGADYELVGNGLAWGIYHGSNGGWQVSQFNLATIPVNTWTFIALVRNGNTFTMYVNGTSVGSVNSSVSCFVGSTPYFLGRRWDLTGSYPYYNGYIDDFRLTRGIARYTTNFTPPTAAFKAR